MEEQNKQKSSANKKKKKIETDLFETKKHESNLNEQLHDLDHRIRRLTQEKTKLQAEHYAYTSIQKQYNRAVTEILKARDSNQLQNVGINTKRAAEFIIINGQQPTYQPQLL